MAVRIVLAADHARLPDDAANALQQVALDVVVALGHERAVQPEQHGIDRHGVAQLAQDLIAHGLVVGPHHRARRLRPEAGALDQREALLLRPSACDVERAVHSLGSSGCWPGGA